MIFDKNVCSRLSFDVERAEMSLQDTFSRFECGNASINKYLSENALRAPVPPAGAGFPAFL